MPTKTKLFLFMKTFKLVFPVVLASLFAVQALAAPTTPTDDNIYNFLQVLRSDFSSTKVQMINRIMKLSADDAKKFWPICRDYENELGKLAISRIELIAEFIKANKDGTLDNPKAKDLAKRWFASQHARLDLLEKYYQKIEEALSSIQAGQFLQIENQVDIFIDMTVAAEMPLVGQVKK